jgi:hypothetical protein
MCFAVSDLRQSTAADVGDLQFDQFAYAMVSPCLQALICFDHASVVVQPCSDLVLKYMFLSDNRASNRFDGLTDKAYHCLQFATLVYGECCYDCTGTSKNEGL